MKNLLYKEFRLSVHWLCYVFTAVFPFLMLFSVPTFLAAVYGLCVYPVLFLGANKSQTTNDLFFTCNLPIRKKEVVKARLLSLSVLQAITFVSMGVFMALHNVVSVPVQPEQDLGTNGLGYDCFIVMYAFLLVGYAINDLIFLPWFYKTGKSVIGPTLVSMLTFVIYASGTLLYLPSRFPVLDTTVFNVFNGGTKYLCLQIGILLVALGIYFALRYLTYRLSSKNLEKLDF